MESDCSDFFDDFVRSAYNLDELLSSKFNRKEGSINGETSIKIIEKLDECFNQEDDCIKKELISLIETNILITETKLMRAKEYKTQIATNDFQYDHKIDVENLHIAYLSNRNNVFKNWIDSKLKIPYLLENGRISMSKKNESKSQKLKINLTKYGFMKLPKVKLLNVENQNKLIELISEKGTPYAIAMFNFLGFLHILEKDYFKFKYEINIKISSWFGISKDGRFVKGNINTLNSRSTENKDRHTAHLYKKKVIKDYQNLN